MRIKGVINQIQIKPAVTSSEVKNKIIQGFKRNATLDAERIKVEVNGDTVTFKGKVRNWSETDEALDVTWALPGISHVDKQLKIFT